MIPNTSNSEPSAFVPTVELIARTDSDRHISSFTPLCSYIVFWKILRNIVR